MAAVDEFDIVGDAVEDDGAPSPSTRRRRGPTPWIAAAVVLVLGGAAIATPVPIVMGRGEGPEAGLLDLPLSQPPTLAWQAELSYPSLASVDVPGRVIVSTDDDGTSRTVVGLDLETGAEVWRFDDDGYSCQWGAQIVCVTDPGTSAAAVVTIDGQDGTLTTAEHPQAIAAIAADGGTAVVEKNDGSGVEDVVLVAPDGTELWRVEADVAETESIPAWTSLRVTDDLVVSDYSGTALNASTGEPAAHPGWVNADGSWIEETDTGSFLHTGDDVIALDASELMVWLDDDVGGSIVFRQDTSGVITASIRDDGTELWQLDDPRCYPWMRIRGSIVIGCWGEAGDGNASALDELTGEPLWVAADADWPITASEDAVLLSSTEQSEIVAVDPVDGHVLWRQHLPQLSYANYLQIDDGLLVSSDAAVALLTW